LRYEALIAIFNAMQIHADTPQEYLASLPMERQEAISTLRSKILDNLPNGFEEIMAYGMLCYVVPHSIYPKGYHCNPKQALPFISLASQKNYISFYHMGLYEGPLLTWFVDEWQKVCTKKLDIGKCCVRFKKTEDIPYDLIGKLCAQLTPEGWVEIYERNTQR
jgi:hypothetical protein